MTAFPAPSEAYTELVSRLERAHTLGTVGGLLGWDEQVNLPSGSVELRAAQSSLLAELAHAASTAPEIGRALDQLDGLAAGALRRTPRAIPDLPPRLPLL